MALNAFQVDAVEDHPDQRQPITYRFGRFLLDTSRRLLLTGSSARPLPEKTFRILLLLLEANGRIVEKEKFMCDIWPEGCITDANLTQHVFMLRQYLGESAREHAYILTIAGRGYRFAIPVETKLGLAMKGSCEWCNAPLASDAPAVICSYECTFCARCADALDRTCPNCRGELVTRPHREVGLGAH